MEHYLQIAKTNLKHNQWPHLCITIVFLGISPLLMGVENLDAVSTAKVLEMYVALIGIILLTPLFFPEQNKDVKDLVEAKFTPAIVVNFIRSLEALLGVVLFTGAYILILKHNQCVFPEFKFFLGTLSEAFFLGAAGLCIYRIFDQIALAYLCPIMLYVMSIGGGKKIMKSYYLFSMTYGDYNPKWHLALTGFLLLTLALAYPSLVRHIRPRRLRRT